MVKTAADKQTKQKITTVDTPKSQMRRAMPAVLRVLIAVLFLAVFAGIFTWYILWQQNGQDAGLVESFMRRKPILTAYSYTIVLLIMCVIAALSWRPFLTIGISFVLSSIIMYINTQKFEYRNAPLLPEDFLMVDQAGTIMQFIDPWSVFRLVLGVVLILVGAGIVEYGMQRVFGPRTKGKVWWERHSILPRTVWTLVALAGLLMFARPILHYNDRTEEADTEWLTGLEFEFWNPKSNYTRDGFIIAFLYNLGGLKEQEPENYSKGKIAEISKEYVDNTDTEYDSLNQVADNIIIVLEESMIDPEILGEGYAHSGGDVLPRLHEIFEKYPSGYMYSPGYGGGTANIEFEVLTSLSNYWAQTSPYVTSLSKLESIPGLIRSAVDDGFTGTGIHAFDGSMYKRNTIYGRMGITNFLDYNLMKHTERENDGEYISDQEIYKEALDVLHDGEDKHVIMIATMQNHLPYDAAGYDKLNFKMINQTAESYQFESYLETIHHADKYLGEFVADLDKLEERTVMLWFGDHAPATLGAYVDSENPELIDLAHLTPYFIYANFDLKELYSEKEVAKRNAKAGFEFEMDGVDLPVVTPNCLMNTLYKVLDVKMSPLVRLTSELCEETPILAPVYSKNDKITESELLKDYRLVNYDILSGKRYWLGL